MEDVKMIIDVKTTIWYKAILWLSKTKAKGLIILMKHLPITKTRMNGKTLNSIKLKDVSKDA